MAIERLMTTSHPPSCGVRRSARARGGAARAVHDVPGGRPGRVVRRNARQRGDSTALRLARARRARDHAGRRIERARLGRRRARSGDSARAGEFGRRRAICVRADAAVTINGLVRWPIAHWCAGLEAWAGTPGTVGGAIFGNAHFGGRLIGEHVVERAPGRAGRHDARVPARRHGVRLRSEPACRAQARFSCRRISG